MNTPVVQLDACEYSKLAQHTPVFNKDSLTYFFYIHVDPDIVRECFLYQVDEISEKSSKRVNPNVIKHDCNCWYKGITELMNTNPGKHTYKMSFVENKTNVTFSLYISYIIQDDNPELPYVYMKR